MEMNLEGNFDTAKKALSEKIRCSAISAKRSFSAHDGMSERPVDIRKFTEFRNLSVSLVMMKQKLKLCVVFGIDA